MVSIGTFLDTFFYKTEFWPWRWPIQPLKTNIFRIYRKNWLSNMGVKTGLWPQQGVQKMVFPLPGGVLAHEKVTKPNFDPEDGWFSSWKQTFSESTGKTGLTTWGSKQAWGHSKGSKNGFCPPGVGGWGTMKSQKLLLTLKTAGKPSSFDPEHSPSFGFWVYGPNFV